MVAPRGVAGAVLDEDVLAQFGHVADVGRDQMRPSRGVGEHDVDIFDVCLEAGEGGQGVEDVVSIVKVTGSSRHMGSSG